MAEYINETDASITTSDGKSVPPDGRYTPLGSKYLKNPRGLTLLTDSESICETLAVSATPFTISDLAKWSQIEIINSSGDVVQCFVNNSDSKRFYMVNGQIKTIDQDRDINTLEITGLGTTLVYVIGWWRKP